MPINRAGIVGAGTMGTGIALAFAEAAIPVTVTDTSADARERMRTIIEHHYRKAVEKQLLSPDIAATRAASIQVADDMAALRDADVIVEAVFEDLTLKATIFAELGSICSTQTILASNTSTLDIDAIAEALPHPERSLGFHFFSPAHVMKLVEIIRGTRTSEQTLAAAAALARRLGKIGIVVGNGDGFVGNRMLRRYRREAEFLLEEGATPQQVDAALTRFGFAMGPFAVSDMNGLDIAYRAKRERAARGTPSSERLSRIPDLLVEMGRLGQKSGAGYYRYEPGSRTPHPDPIVDELLARERALLGNAPRSINNEEIARRCLLALAEEGAAVLREGIAQRSEDIDAIWIHGYGFPPERGGPMRYAAKMRAETTPP